MRMHSLIITVAFVALFLPSQATTTDTKPAPTELSESQKEVLFRSCKGVEPSQLERCKARQLARSAAAESRKNPEGAYDAYEAMDLGQGRMRKRLQENKLKLSKERAATMKSFGEDPIQQTTSLQPRDYVDFIRKERLACMLKPAGRQRALCLDALGNTARQLMKDARPSSQLLGQ